MFALFKGAVLLPAVCLVFAGFSTGASSYVAPSVDTLESKTPRYFDPTLEHPYAVSSGDFADAMFGTSVMIAYHYLSEENSDEDQLIQWPKRSAEIFHAVRVLLISEQGEPLALDEPLLETLKQANFFGGDNGIGEDALTVWSIDDALLILSNAVFYGDGDITSTVSLSRVPSQRHLPELPALDIKSTMSAVVVAEESSSEVRAAVHALSQNTSSARITRTLANEVFALVDAGSAISERHYLWTLYALIRAAYPEVEDGLPQADYLAVADAALQYLHKNGVGSWQFTDQGQFNMEVYRMAGNGAAWALRKSEPERALGYAEAALEYARDEDKWLQDTYVRVLINLKQTDKAFAIVKTVLEEDPDFGDFQDFLGNENYLRWLQSSGQ